MKDCIAIRTHRWGEEEARLVAQLTPVFGDNVLVAFHNRPTDIVPPIQVADFDDTWVETNGLRRVYDYGWRCGDYALYALRQAYPGYDRYWLIEPDVAIVGDVEAFFRQAESIELDALGVDFAAQVTENSRFVKGLPGIPPHKATFAFTRFSGVAIDRLFALRKDYSVQLRREWHFANDETFCFSHLAADKRFSVGAMSELLPAWFSLNLFGTNPDILDRAVLGITGDGNQICHPVRSLEGFTEALMSRLLVRTQFLNNIAPSFRTMTECELEEFSQRVGQRVHEVILKIRSGSDG